MLCVTAVLQGDDRIAQGKAQLIVTKYDTVLKTIAFHH